MFTSIVTTGERFTHDLKEGALIIANKGDLKMWQTVLAVGTSVRDIKVGDKVMLNMENYAVKKYSKNSLQNDINNNKTISYNFNWVTIDDKNDRPQECMIFNDRDVLYVFEGEEDDNTIITPPKPVFMA